jgi:type I restriction enzyme S subunit
MTQTKFTVTTSLTSKRKSYPTNRESGIEWLGTVPKHWMIKRLGHVSKVIDPQPDHRAPALSQDEGFPYIGIRDVNPDGTINVDTARKIEEEAVLKQETSFRIDAGDIIFCKVGTLGYPRHIKPIGRIALSATLVLIKCNQLVTTKYLRYVLDGQGTYTQIDLLSTGSTRSALGIEQIRKFTLCVPPLSEQYAIATFLDRETTRINALIAKKEQLIGLLQEKRAALISHTVTMGLDPTVPMKDSGVGWLGEIPAHWEMKRLKFVTSFVTSGSRGWAQYYSDDGAIFIRIGNLSRTSIALDLQDIQYVTPPDGAEGERTRVRQHDVLISITAYIGSVAVVSGYIGEAYVNQHIALSRPRQSVIASKWLGYCLLSKVGQGQFHLLLYGGTKDGLGLDDIKNLLVLVPPISEQQAIATYLDRETAKIDTLISRIRKGIEKLREYSTAIISAAVTGKIDVRGEIALPHE